MFTTCGPVLTRCAGNVHSRWCDVEEVVGGGVDVDLLAQDPTNSFGSRNDAGHSHYDATFKDRIIITYTIEKRRKGKWQIREDVKLRRVLIRRVSRAYLIRRTCPL